ncbi:MAG: AAA family ATPase, partial [Calditerrivibrio sp.]|nr:AAA family ATPase [Calditerrivibrio sp.]
PVIVVTTPKIGTLNHTFLSLEFLKNRKVDVLSVIYNNYTNKEDEITLDNIMTMKYFYPEIPFIETKDIERVVDIIEKDNRLLFQF